MKKVILQNLADRNFIMGSLIVKAKETIIVELSIANHLAKLYPKEIKIISTEESDSKPKKVKNVAVQAVEENEGFEDGIV